MLSNCLLDIYVAAHRLVTLSTYAKESSFGSTEQVIIQRLATDQSTIMWLQCSTLSVLTSHLYLNKHPRKGVKNIPATSWEGCCKMFLGTRLGCSTSEFTVVVSSTRLKYGSSQSASQHGCRRNLWGSTPVEDLLAVGEGWGRKESFFFQDVASGKLPRVLWLASHPCIHISSINWTVDL